MATMITPLARAIRVGPTRPAVVCGETSFTYAETWERCRRLAGGLRALGLGDGDRVVVVGPNCHRYLELYQAIPGAGLSIVPLNQRHTPAELRYAIEDSGARVLFTGIGDAGLGDGCVEHVVDLGDGYERFLAAAEPADLATTGAAERLAGLFYTGGTTGASKGVMLTHRNLLANAMHFQACWPFTPDTRWLIIAPLFHAAGSIAVLATVWNAGTPGRAARLRPGPGPRPHRAEHGVTATLVVPTMLAAMSEEQLARPRDVSIAAATSATAARRSRPRRCAAPTSPSPTPSCSTSTGRPRPRPIATLMPHEERLLDTPRARSCGQPAVGVEVGRAADRRLAGRRRRGRRGRDPRAERDGRATGTSRPRPPPRSSTAGTARATSATRTTRRYLFLVDRAKDMIVTGGENVYSTEVEDVALPPPGRARGRRLRRARRALGRSRARGGRASGRRSRSRTCSPTAGRSIAGYKVPKEIELRDEPLPKSGAGKVLKRELRDPFWAGRTERVGG